MAYKDKDIKFVIEDAMDYIIQEKGNTYVALRKVSWNDKEPKVELRTWYTSPNEGDDTPGKGVALTEEGCNELSTALLKEGYGDTLEVISIIKDRNDYQSAFDIAMNDNNGIKDIIIDDEDEDLYDPKSLLEEDFC